MSREELGRAFTEALDLPPDTNVEALEIGKNPEWDSLGHMALIAEFEDRFGVTLETDDVVALSSYAAAIEILRRHGVEV